MVDRFSLFRIWGWNPQLGAELASFSRKYMILGCLAVFAVISSFVFAQFPYDNVCDPPDPVAGVAGQYLGVKDANGEVINQGTGSDGIVVVFQDTAVQFCEQSRGRSDEFWFPATKRVQGGGLTWFGDEQVKHSWTLAYATVKYHLLPYPSSAVYIRPISQQFMGGQACLSFLFWLFTSSEGVLLIWQGQFSPVCIRYVGKLRNQKRVELPFRAMKLTVNFRLFFGLSRRAILKISTSAPIPEYSPTFLSSNTVGILFRTSAVILMTLTKI